MVLTIFEVMNESYLHIQAHYGDALHTKGMATRICKEVKGFKNDSVKLDFKGITAMSWSFAHQFCKERQRLRDRGVSLFLINLAEQFEKILEVAGSKKKTDE